MSHLPDNSLLSLLVVQVRVKNLGSESGSDMPSVSDLGSLSEELLEAVLPGPGRVEHLLAHGKCSIDVCVNVPVDASHSLPGRMVLGLQCL